MTRSEACEVLGISENASAVMARAAYKMLRAESASSTEKKVLATALNVALGAVPAESGQANETTQNRKPAKRPAPATAKAPRGQSREVRAKGKYVARQSATAATKTSDKGFRKEAPLPENAFQNLSELSPSRSYESYQARAFGLLKYETGPSGENWDLSISPDDRTFLVASASWVYKWDIASGKLVKGASKFGLVWDAHSTSDTYGCDISSDGRLAATANAAGEVFIWNYQSGEVLHKLRTHGAPRRVKFALNNTAVVVVGWNKIALLWHFESGLEKPLPLEIPNITSGDRLSGLDVSKDGKRAYVVAPKMAITAWDLENCTRLWTTEVLDAHYTFSNLAVSPNEQIALASQPNGLWWWDLEQRKLLQPYHHGSPSFFNTGPAAAISSDGRFALAPMGNDIILWSLPDRKPLRRLKGHQNRVDCIRFSSDGSFAISSGHDRTAKLWRF